MHVYRLACLLLAFALLGLMPGTAHAAESYDNCNNFIDSLPATISTQGVWCLRKDLATNITSGDAITIAANNVTIDCNDFKIGGLAAGSSSVATGIYALERQNGTVRHCNIRGFLIGIYLRAGAGHLIEDNRLDNNLQIGILTELTDGCQVRRNAIYDTGGYPTYNHSYGIYAAADIIDNTVSGVFANVDDSNTSLYGILDKSAGATIHGNTVKGLAISSGYAYGIYGYATGQRIERNHVNAAASTIGYGVWVYDEAFCMNNSVRNFTTAYKNCAYSSGNASL